MKKIKIYKMPISEFFPRKHKRAGEPTDFMQKIINALDGKEPKKLHTLRAKCEAWKRKIDEVIEGDAILVVFAWSKKPYRSAQQDKFVFGKNTDEVVNFIHRKYTPDFINNKCRVVLKDEVEIGVQELEFGETYHYFDKRDLDKMGTFGAGNTYAKIKGLAQNDGLSEEDFREWFKNYDLSEPLAVIHFTNFRY